MRMLTIGAQWQINSCLGWTSLEEPYLHEYACCLISPFSRVVRLGLNSRLKLMLTKQLPWHPFCHCSVPPCFQHFWKGHITHLSRLEAEAHTCETEIMALFRWLVGGTQVTSKLCCLTMFRSHQTAHMF